MRCQSCKVEVPPKFAKAIMDNACPACGKEIFSTNDFRELLRVKMILSESGLEENLSVSVAAAISQKYDLIVKGLVRPKSDAQPDPEQEPSTDGLTTEEKTKLQELYNAKKAAEEKEEKAIINEWGLEQGDSVVAQTVKSMAPTKKLIDPKMAELFADGAFGEISADAPLNFNSRQPNHERLARAEALRTDPSRFRITRAE